MARLISLLIDRSHQRLLGGWLWLVSFTLVVAIGILLALVQVGSSLRGETQRSLSIMQDARSKIDATAALLAPMLTAEPCSAAFHDQLRELAYRPDGINEFLYAPDGVVLCSVSQDIAAFDLGVADVVTGDSYVYLERRLDFLGLGGAVGTISRSGDFAMVIPPFNEMVASSSWFEQQLVMRRPGGAIHRAGVTGIAERAAGAVPLLGLLGWNNGAFYFELCDYDGLQCAITEASLQAWLEERWPTALLGLATAALLALGISSQAHHLLRHFWSFESRFRRRFRADTVICTYQPILSFETGKITGCEVLVRWRDVDGSVVFPDQFLPVVVKYGLGRNLTRYVVDCAYRELSATVPPHIKLQVNINIFPADLDSEWLREVLAAFTAAADRFSVVVEIVESDEIDIHTAQREIEALRCNGIATYLDDFGTGYSNIQNLASLALGGVKLDRSFAMSPDGSLMNKMLLNAIELIHSAGHRLTVEGVETENRLRMLQSTGLVDFVQGYLISRPLDIERFVQVLGEEQDLLAKPRRLVA